MRRRLVTLDGMRRCANCAGQSCRQSRITGGDAVGHMDHGAYVPVIAYLVSCMGCALGLVCTIRARIGTRAWRNFWLVMSAVSIGGTGIWGMHFVGMLGVTVHGSVVRWDVSLTILSLVVAIGVVGGGMFLVGYGPRRSLTLLTAGLITGSGVAI